jgi:hypothetical protein
VIIATAPIRGDERDDHVVRMQCRGKRNGRVRECAQVERERLTAWRGLVCRAAHGGDDNAIGGKRLRECPAKPAGTEDERAARRGM